MQDVLISILLLFVGLIVGIIVMFIFNNIQKNKANNSAEKIISNAKDEAEKIKKDMISEAKKEANELKNKVEEELKEKKSEAKELEKRLISREESIDKRNDNLQNREKLIDEKEQNLIDKQNDIQNEKAKEKEIKNQQLEMKKKISGYTKDQAKEIILGRVEESMNLEIASLIKEKEEEAKLIIDKKSKTMLVECMQKYASEVVEEKTITVVNLENDDMKGRIIGREGRNIRTIEAVTGVDLIIDDTPEAIVLSSFDPLRREIARVTVETLIKDGRIHPARIEEIYDKTAQEMHAKILEYGEEALFELGITKVDPELVELIGRLQFRTSYGQNCLKHSIEVANLAGIMAAELGENVMLAKRAGLLHDIGKAIDHEIEGSHVDIGSNIAHKYNENDIVINAIESHHGDCETTSVISSLIAIADTLSATRPGARNDSLENYVQRLRDLEDIANEITGVEKSFAMQAGRELRVLVKPEEIDDITSHKIARDIKQKIEEKLQYPGTIKVTVIRETRAIEEAK